MSNFFKTVMILFMALLFSACGGGGGSDASFTQEKKQIDVLCVGSATSSDIDSYITLNSQDSIVKEDTNSVVTIYHNTNGEKKVCLNSGKAHIVRN